MLATMATSCMAAPGMADRSPSVPLRIGIVGARGIGKHQAKWFHLAGCEVTAIYGTSGVTAERSAEALRDLFGFSGRVYSDWRRFIEEGGFDACAVCSPAEHHWTNVRDLAAAGKHILCEKPLAWNWDYRPRQIVEEATALVEAAARHNVILGVNAQYPAMLPGWERLYREVTGESPEYRAVSFALETKGKPRSSHGPAEAWVDLAPHPLAVLDALAIGCPDWSTLRHWDGNSETVVEFDWVSGNQRLPVHLECRRISGDGAPRRQFGNQRLTAKIGAVIVDGDYATQLEADARAWVGPDLMRASIHRFIEAVRTQDSGRLLVDGPAALRQQEVLVGVWQRCWG